MKIILFGLVIFVSVLPLFGQYYQIGGTAQDELERLEEIANSTLSKSTGVKTIHQNTYKAINRFGEVIPTERSFWASYQDDYYLKFTDNGKILEVGVRTLANDSSYFGEYLGQYFYYENGMLSKISYSDKSITYKFDSLGMFTSVQNKLRA